MMMLSFMIASVVWAVDGGAQGVVPPHKDVLVGVNPVGREARPGDDVGAVRPGRDIGMAVDRTASRVGPGSLTPSRSQIRT